MVGGFCNWEERTIDNRKSINDFVEQFEELQWLATQLIATTLGREVEDVEEMDFLSREIDMDTEIVIKFKDGKEAYVSVEDILTVIRDGVSALLDKEGYHFSEKEG